MTNAKPNDKKYRPGDQVRIDIPGYLGVWTVEKVNPKNTVVTQEGRRVNVRHHMLLDAGDPQQANFMPLQEPFYPGELVEWNDPRAAGLYVVVSDTGRRVNIAIIGGDQGRYWRTFHRSLTKIDPKQVLR